MKRSDYNLNKPSIYGERKNIGQHNYLFDNDLKMLKKGSMVLEIGAGFGHFGQVCAARGHNYICIEPSISLRRVLQ